MIRTDKSIAFYPVTTAQFILHTLVTAVFVAVACAATAFYIKHAEMPTVSFDEGGKCVKVINYRNGDGFSCQDVDVTLRSYKRIAAN